MESINPTLLFTDFFKVKKAILDEYGAFNISLLADLPLFIDPFLLFHSQKPEYQQLHTDMIEYLSFLRDRSYNETLDSGLISAWFAFKEVKQTWLGFSAKGNRGSALGQKFAHALHNNFSRVLQLDHI